MLSINKFNLQRYKSTMIGFLGCSVIFPFAIHSFFLFVFRDTLGFAKSLAMLFDKLYISIKKYLALLNHKLFYSFHHRVPNEQ